MIEKKYENLINNTIATIIDNNISEAKGEQDYWTTTDEEEIRNQIVEEVIEKIKESFGR